MHAVALALLSVLAPEISPSLDGRLTDDIVIESELLGYKLQYRVYLPPGYDAADSLPVIYVTDGQWYIEEGQVPQVIDELVVSGTIDPVIAVFLDNRDPDNLDLNRRNAQFFCNPRYARFFERELIPEIDQAYKTSADRTDRVILGVSFGGLNSACFGLMIRDAFEGIAMQSPAMHPVPTIHDSYAAVDRLPLRIFLSSGSERDNEAQTRRLRDILKAKDYEMKYIEVPHGHNWRNWGPLIDDILIYFFGRG